jgi:hypothetical protein
MEGRNTKQKEDHPHQTIPTSTLYHQRFNDAGGRRWQHDIHCDPSERCCTPTLSRKYFKFIAPRPCLRTHFPNQTPLSRPLDSTTEQFYLYEPPFPRPRVPRQNERPLHRHIVGRASAYPGVPFYTLRASATPAAISAHPFIGAFPPPHPHMLATARYYSTSCRSQHRQYHDDANWKTARGYCTIRYCRQLPYSTQI